MTRMFLAGTICLFLAHSITAADAPQKPAADGKFDGHMEKTGANVDKAVLAKANELVANTGCSITFVTFGVTQFDKNRPASLFERVKGYSFAAESPKGAKERRFMQIDISPDGKIMKLLDRGTDTSIAPEAVKNAYVKELEEVKSKGKFKPSADKPWITKTIENDKPNYQISTLNTSKSEYFLVSLAQNGKVLETSTGHACSD